MGSTLVQRRAVCADESLWERVGQAMVELGKQGVLASVVAGIVLASPVVGEKATTVGKLLGPSITDEEIIAYVKALP